MEPNDEDHGGVSSQGTPYGDARVVEVANVAWPGHEPCLELLELPGGRYAVRFAAYVDGRPFPGALVVEERAIDTLAAAIAATPRLKSILARLVSAVREE